MKFACATKRAGLLLLCVGAIWCMPGCGGSPSSSGDPSNRAPLTSITVAFANPSVSVGATDQFTATGTYSNGTTQNITGQVTWSSSNTALVTINASGLATGVAAGSATIQASLSGVNGSVQVTVTAATLQSIAVTAPSLSIAQGTTDQFTATGTYSNGTTQNLTSQVTWSSSNTAVATISASGLASSTSAGSTTIQASLSGINGSAQLTVTSATLQSIAVTATSLSIAQGTTDQFTATGTYSNGSMQNLTSQATWTSSNTAVATISASGLATSAAAGSTTIQASLSGINGSAQLTVTLPTSLPNYGSGFTSAGLTLNGSATINGTRLRLTDGGAGEAGSAFFSTPVNVTTFTNVFTFQDTNASADGLCFVIEASGPTALGAGGGALGYAGTTGPLSRNSLCVDFDLYNNVTFSEISNTGLFTDGASPANGAGSAAGSLSFQSGDVMSVQMSYDGTTLAMQITDTVTDATYDTSFTVNIPSLVGGSTAYVGFTGGTGGLTAIQDILTWTYSPMVGTSVAPTITTQPLNQTVAAGQMATFSVVASGSIPLSYQWLENAGSGFTSISGANSGSYTTPATTSANSGATFKVTVTNSQGSATSNAATLTVTSATLVSIAVTPTNSSVAAGSTLQFAATGTYSDQSTANITSSVTWASSSTTAATISAAGLATGVTAGQSTTISATQSSIAGSTSLTVASSSGFAGVLTQHNDNGRTGQNLNEAILTLSNVNATTFGKLFSMPVDGYVYAQPLYMPNVSIAGGTHNVLYAATEGDSVFAFDADTGAQLWQASLIDTAHGATSGETTVSASQLQTDLGDPGCTDLIPQVGITSTPVIDPSTGTIYVEAKSSESNGTILHRLHMLDITTGAEKPSGPVVITATVAGVTFDALTQLNRPGLLLSNGTVYIGYASHCDDGPWHGWLFAYNASTLAQTAVYISTPNGQGAGGIWMSGAGISADSSGNIFVATGNGAFDATDEGDSIVKLNGSTLALTDYFTPFNQGDLDAKDFDLGSGGVLLLPDQAGAHPHELVEAGKGGQELDLTTSLGGIIYVVDRDQMTTNNSHYCSSSCNNTDPEIVQEIQNVGSLPWLFAMPAYWSNTVYFWGSSDVLRAYTLTNGQLGTSPSSSATVSFGFPGATPSISANGNSNGIVWAIETDNYGLPAETTAGPAILRAFQATNVGNQIYASNQSGSRDTAGNAVKFAVPTIANGKVYIGTQTEVDVYGLCAVSGCP